MPSSSTAALFFGLLLVAGAILWVAGTRLSRVSIERAHASITWTRAILDTDQPVDAAMRLEMIERLAIVGEPWCAGVLRDAHAQERDERMRDAAERALLVIAARS